MRVDYQPVEPSHRCKLPPTEDYPLGTVIVCDEVASYAFNGASLVPIRCRAQWRLALTFWKSRRRWFREG